MVIYPFFGGGGGVVRGENSSRTVTPVTLTGTNNL